MNSLAIFDNQHPSFAPEKVDFSLFIFDNDLKAALPELFLVMSCLFLLLYGVIWSTSVERRYPLLLRNVNWLSLLVLGLTVVIAANNPISNGVFFYHTFLVSHVTTFFKAIVLLGALSSLLISLDHLERESLNGFEFPLLLLLSTSSMLFLISAADFISMYLAIELQSLCFYVLAAFKRDSEFSTEAGLKYFLLGVFSSGLLLFGCSLVYGFTGAVEFSELSKIFASLATPSSASAEAVDAAVSLHGVDGSASFYDVTTSTSSWRGCELGMIFLDNRVLV